MKMLITLLSLLFITANLHAEENDCDRWLNQSTFGQMLTTDQSKEANVDSLLKAFQDFRMSAHRGDAGNFDQLLHKVEKLKAELTFRLQSKKANLKLHQDHYDQNFTRAQKIWPWSSAATYMATHIIPGKNLISNLHADIEILEEIILLAQVDRSYADINKHAHEARLTLLAAKKELGFETAFLLARALIGYRGDIKPQIELAKNLIRFFKNEYSDKVALKLTIALIEARRTDLETQNRTLTIYNTLVKNHKPEVALGLTTIIIKNGATDEIRDKVVASFSELSEKTALEGALILPFIGPTLKRYNGGFAQRYPSFIGSHLQNLEKQPNVTPPAAIIMMSAVWSLEDVLSANVSIDKILKNYNAFLLRSDLNPTTAALLAAASLLSNPKGEVSPTKVLELLDVFHKVLEIDANLATSMVFKVLVMQSFEHIPGEVNQMNHDSDSSSTLGNDLLTYWLWSNILFTSSGDSSSSLSTWGEPSSASTLSGDSTDNTSDNAPAEDSSSSDNDSGGGGDGGE